MKNLSKYIYQSLSGLPDSIADFNAIERIIHFSSKIDKEFAYFLAGFEVNLRDPQKVIDVFCSLSVLGQSSRAVIKKIISNDLFMTSLSNSQNGILLSNFLIEWNDEKSSLYDIIENIWFEYDYQSLQNESTLPSIFIGLNQNYLHISYDDIIHKYLKFNEIVLNYFKLENSNVNFENLINIFKKIPDESQFSHLGLMLGREQKNIRIFIKNIKHCSIISYLKSINWKGNYPKLEEILKSITSYFDFYSLQLTLNESGLENKIGLECFIDQRSQFFNRKYCILCDYLSQSEELVSQKVRDLIKIPNILYPESACFINGVYKILKSTKIRRGFHHVKYSISDSSEAGIKNYYYFESDWY